MWWLFWAVWAAGILLVLAYALALPFGAPYLPTLKKPARQALDLLDLKPGEVFVDLGCGDGRLLEMAAARGLKAVGYELNPFLWFYAWVRTRRHGRCVRVRLGNFWRADLSDADGVFVFLIGHHMVRLDELLELHSRKHRIKLVSHAFKIPGKKPLKRVGAMYLYIYGPIAKTS